MSWEQTLQTVEVRLPKLKLRGTDPEPMHWFAPQHRAAGALQPAAAAVPSRRLQRVNPLQQRHERLGAAQPDAGLPILLTPLQPRAAEDRHAPWPEAERRELGPCDPDRSPPH